MKVKGIAAVAVAMVLATGCSAQNAGQPNAGTATTSTTSTSTSTSSARPADGRPGAEADPETVALPATAGSGSKHPAARPQSLAAYLQEARAADRKLRVAEQLVLAAAGSGARSLDARTRAAIRAVDLNAMEAALPPVGLSDDVLTPALNLYGGLSARKHILFRYRNALDDLDAANGPRNYAEARGCLQKLREVANRFAPDLAAMQKIEQSHPALRAAEPTSEAGIELATQFIFTSAFDGCRRSCGGKVLGNPWRVAIGRMPTTTRAGTVLSGPTAPIGISWNNGRWQFEMNGC
jgi:hypothetical protein